MVNEAPQHSNQLRQNAATPVRTQILSTCLYPAVRDSARSSQHAQMTVDMTIPRYNTRANRLVCWPGAGSLGGLPLVVLGLHAQRPQRP